jgi:hypothetical protein
MGQFYIDESIHDHAGFIICAITYSEVDLSEKILSVIKQNEFNPDSFEFKSNTNYVNEPEKKKVREELKILLVESCRLGLVIVPREKRAELGSECLKALRQFIKNNSSIQKPLEVFFDQGIFNSNNISNNHFNIEEFSSVDFYLSNDSKIIRPIQLADLAAHIAAIQLKAELGFLNKKVKYKPYLNDDFETEMELEFEMFLTIRYCLFNSGFTEYTGDFIKDGMIQIEPYGLYISDFCNDSLTKAARNIFGEIFLGSVR